MQKVQKVARNSSAERRDGAGDVDDGTTMRAASGTSLSELAGCDRAARSGEIYGFFGTQADSRPRYPEHTRDLVVP